MSLVSRMKSNKVWTGIFGIVTVVTVISLCVLACFSVGFGLILLFPTLASDGSVPFFWDRSIKGFAVLLGCFAAYYTAPLWWLLFSEIGGALLEKLSPNTKAD